MPTSEHVNLLTDDVKAWNRWRRENPHISPDLSSADLSEEEFEEANLAGADLSSANLSDSNLDACNFAGANLSQADLCSATLGFVNFASAKLSNAKLDGANLDGATLNNAKLDCANLVGTSLIGADGCNADLTGAKMNSANLHGANFEGANFTKASLVRVNMIGANLIGANLHGANLHAAQLIDTDLRNAILSSSQIFGVSAWGVKLGGADQRNLVITPPNVPPITVDNLEVGQFIYLLLNNRNVRSVIDTITSKVVLILGRFTQSRKMVLDAIRDALRRRDYLPVVCDFEKPLSRDMTETVATLAHMARFVIADITEARSIPQELQGIVPDLPSVPIQPLLLASEPEYGLFDHFKRYPWVLDTYVYASTQELLVALDTKVIAVAEESVRRMRTK